MIKPDVKQRIMSIVLDENGRYYYNGALDGVWGAESEAAAARFLSDFTGDKPLPEPQETDMDCVMVFSLAKDGNINLTANFKVREFACKDGSDPVFIHPKLPEWCQKIRDKFGYPFSPNSAYRTVSHNAKKDVGGAARSFHIYGLAVDIPANGNVTPQMLYDFAQELVGESCEVGIYSWGIHMAWCKEKKRFRG